MREEQWVRSVHFCNFPGIPVISLVRCQALEMVLLLHPAYASGWSEDKLHVDFVVFSDASQRRGGEVPEVRAHISDYSNTV